MGDSKRDPYTVKLAMDRFPTHPGPPLTPVSLGLHPFPGPRGSAPGGYVPSPTCLSSPSLTSSPLNLSPLTPSQSNLNTHDDYMYVCMVCALCLYIMYAHIATTLAHAVLVSFVCYFCVCVQVRIASCRLHYCNVSKCLGNHLELKMNTLCSSLVHCL